MQLRSIGKNRLIYRSFNLSVMVITVFIVSSGAILAAQSDKCSVNALDSSICLNDAGGAAIVNICFINADGTLSLFYEQKALDVVPASDDYSRIIMDACEAMNIASEDCRIYPMFVSIGENAITTMCDGKKAILFDRNLSTLLGHMEEKFAIYHELGHHFCGHLDLLPSLENELEADAFAGAIFRKLGLSLEDALSILEYFDDRTTHSHPDIAARAAAISKGWIEPDLAKDCR